MAMIVSIANLNQKSNKRNEITHKIWSIKFVGLTNRTVTWIVIIIVSIVIKEAIDIYYLYDF